MDVLSWKGNLSIIWADRGIQHLAIVLLSTFWREKSIDALYARTPLRIILNGARVNGLFVLDILISLFLNPMGIPKERRTTNDEWMNEWRICHWCEFEWIFRAIHKIVIFILFILSVQTG